MHGRASFFVVTALLVTIYHVSESSCCIGGRYGTYENWPSKGDWEELFMLLTGKYGNGGWGWHSQDSYSYKGVGDYSYSSGSEGSSGYRDGWFSSSPSDSPSSLYSSSHNHNTNPGSNTPSTSIDTNKMKKALSDYFNAHKNHHVSTANAGGVGQSFFESPRPPSYSHLNDNGPPSYSHLRDDGPPLPAGPPYEPPEVHWSSPPGPPGPPPDSPHHWPPPEPESARPYYGNNNNNNIHQGPSPTLGFNHNSNHNSDNTNRFKNLFQTDYEVFGRMKKRRNGKRRFRTNAASPEQPIGGANTGPSGQGQAGLPTLPNKPRRPFRRLPHKRRGYRKQRLLGRRQLRIARRKLNTSFGGYKLDHSRFHFWKRL